MSPISRLRGAFSFPILCALTGAAGLAPLVTAPHDANACSGSAGWTVSRESQPTVLRAEATDTDLVIVRSTLQTSTGPNGGVSVAATAAHVETTDGIIVPLSRNDFSTATAGASLRIIVPSPALAPNTSYVLVVEGVLLDTSPGSQPTTVQVPFKTGATPHAPLVAPAVATETARGAAESTQTGFIYCGQSSDWKPAQCGQPAVGQAGTLATTQRVDAETLTLAWVPPGGSKSVAYQASISTAPGGPPGNSPSSFSLQLSADGTAGEPFDISLAQGESKCVKLAAIDLETGATLEGDAVCFTASPSLQPPTPDCAALSILISTPASQLCASNPVVSALVAQCELGAGGATGGSGGTGGSTGTGGGSDSGGSSGTGGSGGTTGSIGGSGVGGFAGATHEPGIAGPVPAAGEVPADAPKAATPPVDGSGCALADAARGDRTAAFAPLLAVVAGIWTARRRRRA